MVADKYPNDEDRSKTMGIALGGIAAGVLSKCVRQALISLFHQFPISNEEM